MKLDEFAEEARRFTNWLTQGKASAVTAREAMSYLLQLYLAGLELEEPSGDYPAADVPDIGLYAHGISAASRRIGVLRSRYYSEVFDPFESPAREAVLGDLVEDFSDIYVDVARGLDLYDRGLTTAAQWHWAFHLRTHWGEHATSAIRALHWDIAKG
jgi:hypothetical protein